VIKRILPALKFTVLIGLAIALASLFIWQRIALQSLSSEIRAMEGDIGLLEKNRDFLKGEILKGSSLEWIKAQAISDLGMENSPHNEIVPYSDSLLILAKSVGSAQNDGPVSYTSSGSSNRQRPAGPMQGGRGDEKR